MKRPVAVAVGSALLAGVGIGAVVMSASDPPSTAAGQVRSDLNVVSRWSGPPWTGAPASMTVTVASGSVQGDPGHGFVLVETPGLRPALFSGPAGTGAFRLVSTSAGGWAFRSRSGSLLLVGAGNSALRNAPSFTYLGPRLNPERLGTIGSSGVAVPLSWGWKHGHSAMTAVVLVEQVRDWPGWKLYGYLPGYWIPRPSPLQPELQRPLVGPDGRAYSVDAKQGRLVPDTAWHAATKSGYAPTYKFGACTTWPAVGSGAYKACPNSIALQHAGVEKSLMQRDLGKYGTADRAWYFLQPSPNGKWLLLEDALGACGIGTWADFLPSGGGALVSAFPDAASSEALGWLPDDTALVAVQTTGCDGAPVGGVYQVWPGSWPDVPAPQLVFAAPVFDATTWGFAR